MVSNYPSAVCRIICIDLLNLSSQELQNYFLICPEINRAKLFLKMLHSKLHNDLFNEENPHLVYIENNYVIGTRRHEQSYKDLQLGGLEILQENTISDVDIKLFYEIEKKLLQKKSLFLSPFLIDCYKSAFKNPVEINPMYFSFLNAFIEVSSVLAKSPIEINTQFNISIFFFESELQESQLVLNKIYFKDGLPLIFVFKDEQNTEYMGWNKNYLMVLQNVKPINGFTIDNMETLNIVLDKINEIGLINLEEEEIAFLEFYSKLK
jgi:hypothetical protein